MDMDAYFRMERRIAPGTRFSQAVYEGILGWTVRTGVRWLDVGCGHHLLPEWRAAAEQRMARAGYLVGLDPDIDALRAHRSIQDRVAGNCSRIPFSNETFDLVTANMVVEHLESPIQQFAEIGRVLKPGGVFLFHTPNAFGYPTLLARLVPERTKKRLAKALDGRPGEDVFPTYYRANTRRSIMDISRSTGFGDVEIVYSRSNAVFGRVAALAVLELFWIRLLAIERLRHFRPTLIVRMRKTIPTSRDSGSYYSGGCSDGRQTKDVPDRR